MIPLKDENPTKKKCYTRFIILFICVVVFFFQISSHETNLITYYFGFKPASFFNNFDKPTFSPALTLLTSIFMHGGWMHLIGNMTYLYIFGDNVESILGHARYFSFYIFCGIGAALGQFFIEPASATPMVGASGAIAGVLGAYMIKFPKAKVHVFAVIIIFITKFIVPAQIVLGIWFIMQLSGGLNSLGINTTGGVAWFAHIGGFLVGVGSLKIFQTFHFEHNE